MTSWGFRGTGEFRPAAHVLVHLRRGHAFGCRAKGLRAGHVDLQSGAQTQPFLAVLLVSTAERLGDWLFCQVQEPPMGLVAKCQQHLADLISQNLSKIWPTIWFCTNLVIISCFSRQNRDQILLDLDESHCPCWLLMASSRVQIDSVHHSC